MNFRKRAFVPGRLVALFAVGVLWGLVAEPALGVDEPLRNWRDDQGKFETSAAFVRSVGGRVVLRRHDGIEMEVGLARLSAADQKFVEDRVNATNVVLPPGTAAESHLVVSLGTQERTDTVVPATVFAEDDRFRYIAAGPLRADHPVMFFDNSPGPSHAFVDLQGTFRRVPLEKVSFDAQTKLVLLAAPKAELPPPFVPNEKATFRRGDGLIFVGHEIYNRAGKIVVERVVREAIVRDTFRDSAGAARSFLTDAVGNGRAARGVFVTRDGTAVAAAESLALRTYLRATPDSTLRPEFDSFQSYPTHAWPRLLTSEVLALRNRVVHGLNSAEVVVQAQLVELPVASNAHKVRLLAVPTNSTSPGKNRIKIENGQWTDRPSEGFLEVDLEASQTDQQIKYALNTPDWPRMQVWGGKFPTPINKSHHNFVAQCVAVDADGKYEKLGEPMQLSYSISNDELIRVRHENRLKLAPHPRGGLTVTGGDSVVKEEPAKTFTLKRATPVAVEARLGVELKQSSNFAWMRLDEKKLARFDRDPWYRLAVAGDGKWAYVVDGNNVLHQIDPATWTDRKTLALPTDFWSLGYCAKGLCVLFKKGGILWILDPDTLEPKFELSLPTARYLAVGENSKWGYALGPELLAIFDVERGVVLHRIRGERYLLAVEKPSSPFGVGTGGMSVSSDGSRLVINVPHAPLYRVDGDDLVREDPRKDYLPDLRVVPFGNFLIHRLPPDGESGIRVVSDVPGLPVRFEKRTKSSEAHAAYDPRGGKLFLSDDIAGFFLTDERGKASPPDDDTRPISDLKVMLLLPDGERCFAADEKSVYVIDVRKDRLKKAVPQ